MLDELTNPLRKLRLDETELVAMKAIIVLDPGKYRSFLSVVFIESIFRGKRIVIGCRRCPIAAARSCATCALLVDQRKGTIDRIGDGTIRQSSIVAARACGKIISIMFYDPDHDLELHFLFFFQETLVGNQ